MRSKQIRSWVAGGEVDNLDAWRSFSNCSWRWRRVWSCWRCYEPFRILARPAVPCCVRGLRHELCGLEALDWIGVYARPFQRSSAHPRGAAGGPLDSSSDRLEAAPSRAHRGGGYVAPGRVVFYLRGSRASLAALRHRRCLGCGSLRPRWRRCFPVVEPVPAGGWCCRGMSFDTLAPYYLGMEAVLAGRILQRCRVAFLDRTVSSRRALLLGEGPGRFLAELLNVNSGVVVTCVEQSRCMIEAAAARMARLGHASARTRFEPMDALHWRPPPEAFDLIGTHFFLDCFRREELERLIPAVAGAAAPRARWLIGDFCVPPCGWRRWRAQIVLCLMYRFFRVTTRLPAARLTPPDCWLEAAGFCLIDRKLANFGLVHSDLWELQR